MNPPTAQSNSKGKVFRPRSIAIIALMCVAVLLFLQLRQNPQRTYQQGLDALKSGDGDKVLRAAAELRKITGFQSHAHMLRGYWFLATQNFNAAAAEFQLAAENLELRAEAYTRGGEAFYRMQRYFDAEGMLQQALEWDESNSDARRWLASAYYDLGAMSNALEHLKIVGANNPTDGRPYRLCGLIEKDFEQFDQAIPEYETALKRELPESERNAVLLELSECLVRQLRYEDALRTLESAPRTAKSRSLEAQCYAALGRTNEAMSIADEAIRLDPTSVSAILTKAGIAIENGQAESVLPILKTAASKHPGDYNILFQLVKALRQTGNTEEADALSPRLEELNALIDKFAALHLQAFKDVSDADLRFQLGQMALRLDRIKLARSWLQAALAIDINHKEARKLLAEIPAE